MLEQKLVLNRLIHFALPLWNHPAVGPPAVPGDFATQPPQLLHINESTGFGTKTSTTAVGAHATKPWRTFNWLHWIPGRISEVQMGANDVLTGPMSGCDLVLYRRNGVECAGHLGTDVGAVAANAAVKAVWNNFAQNAIIPNLYGGFNPFLDWLPPYPAQQPSDVGAPTFYGLYTTAHTFYTLVLYAQRVMPGAPGAHLTLKRIAGLRQINSKTVQQLRNL